METILPSQLIQEFKNFIHSSCKSTSELSQYSSLHKGIIKMYFGARRVEIDYENNLVKAEIPISDNDYTTVDFECQDIERFLASCIKEDRRSLSFYQSALNYYNYTPTSLSKVA